MGLFYIVLEVWGFLDCIWWSLMTLTTVGFHIQPEVIFVFIFIIFVIFVIFLIFVIFV